VNSLFYETKFPMVDMKVLIYSNFSKKKFVKKMKSPSSMRNGGFHPSNVGARFKKLERKLSKGFP
jgi:hypothetical protein